MTGMFARQAHAFATHRIDGPELEAAWRDYWIAVDRIEQFPWAARTLLGIKHGIGAWS